jgi:hypothetical protein
VIIPRADISWQTALANSAVSAAEDVRSAVRAARTAENAKAAASAAAYAAQTICDAGGFPTIDEARGAQTRASIAQSHAFHAAVVEHEAKAVKRRATLALAHDVKCWNVHRKREMLQACIAHARSQLESTRRAVDAWSCLRDGFIGSSVIPSAQTRKATAPPAASLIPTFRTPLVRADIIHTMGNSGTASSHSEFESPFMQSTQTPALSVDTLGAGVFGDLLGFSKASSSLGSSHQQRQNSLRGTSSASFGVAHHGSASDEFNYIDPSEAQPREMECEQDDAFATIYQDTAERPVIVAVEHNILGYNMNPEQPAAARNVNIARAPDYKSYEENEVLPFAQPVLAMVTATAAPVNEFTMPTDGIGPADERKNVANNDDDMLSSSMQSLVDGLITWGGQFEGEDILPTGMAASIAFESNDAMNVESSFS